MFEQKGIKNIMITRMICISGIDCVNMNINVWQDKKLMIGYLNGNKVKKYNKYNWTIIGMRMQDECENAHVEYVICIDMFMSCYDMTIYMYMLKCMKMRMLWLRLKGLWWIIGM